MCGRRTRLFQFSIHLFKGMAEAALYCAHSLFDARRAGHARRARGAKRGGPGGFPTARVLPFSLEGGLDGLLLRVTIPPAHPPARRDVPLAQARAFQSSSSLVKGVAKAALYCAHRTSTVSPCAFCEQEGHLAASAFPPFELASTSL